MLLLFLLYLFHISEASLAVNSRSLSGKHFVMAFPSTTNGPLKFTHAHISTYEVQANVDLFKPSTLSDSNFTRTRFVIKKEVGVVIKLELKYGMIKGGIYSAPYLTSDKSILCYLRVSSRSNGDFYELIPKQSCHKEYRVASRKKNGFLLVITFDVAATVNVTFSNSTKPFSFNCNADKKCAPGVTVSFKLEVHQVWYLDMRPFGDSCIHNSVITSDENIFAVSGNGLCHNPNYVGTDFCITALQATVSWGREYFVPSFYNDKPREILLAFIVEEYPFTFYSINNGIATKATVDNNEDFKFLKAKTPIILRSEVHFGVFLYLQNVYDLTESQMAVLGLIPVEQWTRGTTRPITKPTNNVAKLKFNVFVAVTSKHLKIPEFGKQLPLKEVKYRNSSYFYMGLLIDFRFYIFLATDPLTRVMVYIVDTPVKFILLARPIDYMQAVIYVRCQVTTAVINDGLDNDCDGSIDEEIVDQEDNDGDGKIDEDTVNFQLMSRWTEWKSCNIECDNKTIHAKFRSCIPSNSSKTCKGNSTNCEPGPCPESKCSHENCTCLTNCLACKIGTGVCDVCQPGYRQSDYCVEKCPKGWTGLNCSQAEQVIVKIKNKKSVGFPSTLVTLLLVFALLSSPAYICCICKKIMSAEENAKNDFQQDQTGDRGQDETTTDMFSTRQRSTRL